MQASKIDEFILADLQDHQGLTHSHDWDADLRFAEFVGDKDMSDWLRYGVVDSDGTSFYRVRNYRLYCSKIKKKRLAALRRLQSRGIVESSWSGTGYEGYELSGLRRVRMYMLKEGCSNETS